MIDDDLILNLRDVCLFEVPSVDLFSLAQLELHVGHRGHVVPSTLSHKLKSFTMKNALCSTKMALPSQI